jgi:hypothetical protein
MCRNHSHVFADRVEAQHWENYVVVLASLPNGLTIETPGHGRLTPPAAQMVVIYPKVDGSDPYDLQALGAVVAVALGVMQGHGFSEMQFVPLPPDDDDQGASDDELPF